MKTAINKIQRAVKEMWARHQDHTWADSDKAQRRAQVVSSRERADDAGEERRAEWLNEQVRAQLCQTATQDGAAPRAHED
jgi:hypothetical protein